MRSGEAQFKDAVDLLIGAGRRNQQLRGHGSTESGPIIEIIVRNVRQQNIVGAGRHFREQAVAGHDLVRNRRLGRKPVATAPREITAILDEDRGGARIQIGGEETDRPIGNLLDGKVPCNCARQIHLPGAQPVLAFKPKAVADEDDADCREQPFDEQRHRTIGDRKLRIDTVLRKEKAEKGQDRDEACDDDRRKRGRRHEGQHDRQQINHPHCRSKRQESVGNEGDGDTEKYDRI